MKHEDALKQPFFAKLLEMQKSREEQNYWPIVTRPLFDQAHTQKYPSDGDDDIHPEPM